MLLFKKYFQVENQTHVFGKFQTPTSAGYLHDEYLKNVFGIFPKASKLITERDVYSRC